MVLLEIGIALLLVLIGQWWYKKYRIDYYTKWIPRVPGIPILGNALDFRNGPTETIKVCSSYVKKYGGLVIMQLMSQRSLLVTDYKMTEFILSSYKFLEKSENYNLFENWIGGGLITSGSTKWKKRRHAITPSFHFQILEKFLDVFEHNEHILVKRLKEIKGEVDIFPYLSLYALDNICEAAMGVSVNCQVEDDSRYANAVKNASFMAMSRNFSVVKKYDFLYKFTSDYKKEMEYINIIHGYTNSVINSRLKALKQNGKRIKIETEDDIGRKKRYAFLDSLLQTEIDGIPLSRDDIREEVDTIMFAGHDTTSVVMSFVLYSLSIHSEIQEKVIEEQKQIFKEEKDRPTTYRDVQNMKYLELVIKETLRLYSPVSLLARTLTEDVEYEGNILPKGLTVTVFPFEIHRNPDFYPDPETFDPSRFERMNGKRPYAYLPFSAGPRNCIGQKFGMLEVKSTLGTILRNFVIFPVPGFEPVLTLEVLTKSSNGIKISLSERTWV